MSLTKGYVVLKNFSVKAMLLLALSTLMMLNVGCETDSYLWDPAGVGRYEHTPTVLPVLSSLDIIEEPEVPVEGLTQPKAEDLIPTISEYTIGPGDFVVVSIFELIQPGVESVQSRRIDELGNIRLQIVGQIQAAGLTAKQLEQRIIDILDPDTLVDPTVSVIVQERRQRTFNVLGGVVSVGSYAILQPNFKLLDAVALARGFNEDVDKLYVIRQISLADVVDKGYRMNPTLPGDHEPPMKKSGKDDKEAKPDSNAPSIIDNLLKDPEDKTEPGKEEAPKPEPKTEAPKKPNPALTGALDAPEENSGGWVNINGKWVRVANKSNTTGQAKNPSTPNTDGDGNPLTNDPEEMLSADELVTQRVIEIDAKELMKGVAKYNIVIRPGDVIHVPQDIQGNVYIGGAVNRPGTYSLPGKDKMTLKQLMISAGNLSGIAVPERVDIIRRVGPNQEAFMRLNYRAIAEGVQPDIFLKPDDTINIGTNFWATPLAVVRNSFRFSYGFGFLLDRNWGFDVWGPQNQGNGGN